MTHTKATAPALLPPTARAPAGQPLTRLERVGAWMTSALRDLVYDAAVAMWSIVAFTILVTVDTLGEAVALAAIGLMLAPLGLLLARGCAAMHAGLVARLLSPSIRAEEER